MKSQWQKLSLDKINLLGIHLDLLQKQAKGLSGHIGEVFPDLSENSAWLGGDGEAWERGPYYIDGLIPLAYLINDKELIKKADFWLDSIMKSQDDTGFFGPQRNLDWWPRAVVLKAMVSAYYATGRKDILVFLEKYLDYMIRHLDESPFGLWGYARGVEGKEALDFLKEFKTKVNLDELENKWKDNTMDWQGIFNDFEYELPTHHYLNKYLFRFVKKFIVFFDNIAKKKKNPKILSKEKIIKDRSTKNQIVFHATHGVNIAMAFKYLMYFDNDTISMFEAIDKVNKYHGNALGLFSADEHLNGPTPDTGVELCTVVEMMYSMEEALRVTGSMEAADRLDTYAYNALLATITKDFTAHQYVQQVNQLDCMVKRHNFYDINKYANTFGVEPNYGCCAANMHQGWPKMFMSAVMKNDKGLVIFTYVNGSYKVDYKDGYILIEVLTNYPFGDTVGIRCIESTVKTDKELILRIPYLAKTDIKLNGETVTIENKEHYIVKSVKKGDEIKLDFSFDIKTLFNADGSVSIKRGSLLYALNIKSEEFYIKGEKPFYDRGYRPLEDSNVGVLFKNNRFIVKDYSFVDDKENFFGNTSSLIVLGYDIKTGEEKELEFIPYGNTILRRTQFDWKNVGEKK